MFYENSFVLCRFQNILFSISDLTSHMQKNSFEPALGIYMDVKAKFGSFFVEKDVIKYLITKY